jgi:hypothetical protein
MSALVTRFMKSRHSSRCGMIATCSALKGFSFQRLGDRREARCATRTSLPEVLSIRHPFGCPEVDRLDEQPFLFSGELARPADPGRLERVDDRLRRVQIRNLIAQCGS